MYERLASVTLKNGEEVEAGVVIGPDPDWADRVEDLLSHKGDVWRWGNRMVLREDLPLEAYFYILHRDGEPFANMMNIEYKGVGLFGHVYTRPEDRRKSAAKQLMVLLMDHFRARGGKALFLGTGYDSHPYHIYRGEGFEGVDPGSGYMAYYAESEDSFYEDYYPDTKADLERLDWPHWPASIPLFLGDYQGIVRSNVMKALGRRSTEGPMIPLQRDEMRRREEGEGIKTAVLVHPETGAVAGLVTHGQDPLWPGRTFIDLYCHPLFWDCAPSLVEAVSLPENNRCVAYCEDGFAPKEGALAEAGFRRTATLPEWLPQGRANEWVDVGVWERE